MAKLLLVFGLVFFVAGSFGRVNAETLEVVGNGANSQNSINVQGTNTNTTNQTTTTSITNTVDANANTGGNSTSGNSGGNSVIITGDANVNVKVTNQGGGNQAIVDNCCGKNPTPTPTKKPSQTPTPTPTPTNGNGGGNGSSNGGSGGNGGVGGGGSNPQIIGLSKTAGEDKTLYLFYTGGLLCLGYAGKLFLRR